MESIASLFALSDDDLSLDKSYIQVDSGDPCEKLMLKVIFLALDDLYGGKILYRLSAICFFRSSNFATYLHHLGCDGDTVDFIYEKLEPVLDDVEAALMQKKGYPEGALLNHRYFSDALDQEELQLEARLVSGKAKAIGASNIDSNVVSLESRRSKGSKKGIATGACDEYEKSSSRFYIQTDLLSELCIR